jgi:hypothetical protein
LSESKVVARFILTVNQRTIPESNPPNAAAERGGEQLLWLSAANCLASLSTSASRILRGINAPSCRRVYTPVYTSTQSRFQSHFGSVVMDERRMVAAARTVALNPRRRGSLSLVGLALVERPRASGRPRGCAHDRRAALGAARSECALI